MILQCKCTDSSTLGIYAFIYCDEYSTEKVPVPTLMNSITYVVVHLDTRSVPRLLSVDVVHTEIFTKTCNTDLIFGTPNEDTPISFTMSVSSTVPV